MLDCFTHTGSFALNAAVAGASSVLGVDASELGCEQARENARLNQVEDRVTFRCADVFELLRNWNERASTYDVVILDPPAFTKSRNSIKNAVKGYREINLRGMKLVRDGGYLATCSCSHFMDQELFAKTLREAAHGAAPAASPGRIPHPGLRPPDPVGRGSVVLSEILHFPGGGGDVG